MSLRVGNVVLAAVCEIATSSDKISAAALAARFNLPPRRLEIYLQALMRASILKGLRGYSGGYVLARSPWTISLDDILSAIDPSHSKEDADPLIRKVAHVVRGSLGQIKLCDLISRARAA